MNSAACAREAEILDAITAGRWAEGCDAELHAHASACAICADLATVASAIAEDAAAATRSASIPSSGLVWWRMQRRMQTESTQNASRTVSLVQVGTLAATFLAVLLLLGGASLLKDWNHWLLALLASPQWHLPLAVAALTCVLLAPVAVYFALAEE